MAAVLFANHRLNRFKAKIISIAVAMAIRGSIPGLPELACDLGAAERESVGTPLDRYTLKNRIAGCGDAVSGKLAGGGGGRR
jgi:hypothetical protein